MELTPPQHIDSEIQDSERLVRSVYYPIHFKNKTTHLLVKSLFESPKGKDEVSVLRLEYTTATFCKQHAQKNVNPPVRREYRGLAVLTAKQIRQQKQGAYQANVKASKLDGLPMHADIFYGYVMPLEKDVPIPPEIGLLIEKLTQVAAYYHDSKPEISEWLDGELLPKSEK